MLALMLYMYCLNKDNNQTSENKMPLIKMKLQIPQTVT